jgi:hypothetical protein
VAKADIPGTRENYTKIFKDIGAMEGEKHI